MSRHLRGLDALRGLAIAVVLVFHGNFAGFSGGFLGVSLFFTVSGFLITSLMLRELADGRINLGHFWARRARRLLPAACAVVVFVVIAAGFGVFELHQSATDGAWALLYGANWHALFASGHSYAQLFSNSSPSPLLHYWSLAIEEQYYFAFPLVCWLCARSPKPRTALTLVLLGVLAVSAHAHLAGWGVDRMYYGTDARIGEIALGALLAVGVDRFGVLERPTQWLKNTAVLLQIPALAITVWAVHTATESSSWLYHGGLLGMGVCWVVLVLGAVLDVGVVRLLARARPVVWLGVVSYGVYLVHWPLLLALHPFHAQSADAVVALSVSLLVAGVSYRFYEKPIRFGELTARLRTGLVASGASAFAVVTLVAAGSNAAASASASATPRELLGIHGTTTAGAPSLRVLVIGDSTGANLGAALVRLARTHTGLIVDNQGVAGCQLPDAAAQNMVREHLWANSPRNCRHWTLRMATARSFKPDVVLAVFGPTVAADLKLVKNGVTTDVTQADEQTATRAEAAALRAEFPKAWFVWATAPRTFSSSANFPERDWLINDPTRIATWNSIVGLFAHRPHSARLDLAAYMNSAPGGWRNRTWRPDGAHLQGAPLARLAATTVATLEKLTGR